MSQPSETCPSHFLQVDISRCFVQPAVRNPNILYLQLYRTKGNQKISTLEKLEPENFDSFSSIQNYQLIIKIVASCLLISLSVNYWNFRLNPAAIKLASPQVSCGVYFI